MGLDIHVSAETRLNLAIDAGTDAEIDRLAGEIRGTKADVFSRALALLKLAVDAKKEGKHLAVVGLDGKLESEITGL
jgi:hypothetical protein